MKIQNAKVDSFIQNLPSNIKLILLYGPDQGLVVQRCDALKSVYAKNTTDFDVVNISYDQFKVDSSIFMTEAFSSSLFGSSKKIIVLRDAKDSYVPILKQYNDTQNSDVLVIILGDDLTPASKLRAFADSSNENIASIACYKDTVMSLRQFILEKTRGQLVMSSIVLSYLLAHLGDNRLISSNEIEKLLLYKAQDDNKELSIEDVENLIGDSSSIFIDKIHFSLFNLDIKNSYSYLEKMLESENAVFVIRALANHVQRLFGAIIASKKGTPLDEIVKATRPMIFFMYVDKFKEQVHLHNLDALSNLMNLLIHKEIQMKQYPNIADVVVKDFFINFETSFKINFKVG